MHNTRPICEISLPHLLVGDAKEWQKFADFFSPRFRRLFRSRGLSEMDAEDLVMTCLSDIPRKVEKYRSEEGEFTAWVFTLARNRLIDKLRQQQAEKLMLTNKREHDRWERSGRSTPPNAQLIAAVQEALAPLKEADRQLLMLRSERSEITFAEMGALLGISEGNARVRYYRLRKQLQATLAGDARLIVFIARAQRE